MDRCLSKSESGVKLPFWKWRALRAPTKSFLIAVLDGAKALKNALLEVYPKTLIQRCLAHKERNLKNYLSTRHWPEINLLFNRLRRAEGTEITRKALADREVVGQWADLRL